jgi:nicotinate-nucleotide adenylyltransferase
MFMRFLLPIGAKMVYNITIQISIRTERYNLGIYGIMGGTFDPVHEAHIRIGEAVLRGLRPDGVLFIPDGDPPHKRTHASGADRMRMIRLAIEGREGFEASDIEVLRGGTTYTVDTLTHLKTIRPGDRFLYIVGADTLFVIETWRDFPSVARMLSGIAVVPRPGVRNVEKQAAFLTGKYRVPVTQVQIEPTSVSSTDIRHMIARGIPTGGLLAENVAAYIAEKGLYKDPTIEELRRTLKPDRFVHTLGVEQTAVELAKRFGADECKASKAALLHDCAKCMSEEEMRALIERHRDEVEEPDERLRPLLHAPAGVALAMEKYGVTDKDVLSAIRWHTTGRANMTQLEEIVYLADSIEPNRRPFPGLEEIRALAREDLDKAVLACAQRTKEYVVMRGYPLNRRSNDLIQWLLFDRNETEGGK